MSSRPYIADKIDKIRRLQSFFQEILGGNYSNFLLLNLGSLDSSRQAVNVISY